MPTAFSILLYAAAGGILLGRRQPLRISPLLIALLYALLFYLLFTRIEVFDRDACFVLIYFAAMVGGLSLPAVILARMIRSRSLAPRERTRNGILSLALVALYLVVVGPLGTRIVAAHLRIARPVVDRDGCVRQTTPLTCGPAALATALGALGRHTTESELAIASGTFLFGTSIFALDQAAQERGWRLEQRRLPLSQADPQRDFPALAVISEPSLGVPHLVAVLESGPALVRVADPMSGTRSMTPETLQKILWGGWYSVRRENPYDTHLESTGAAMHPRSARFPSSQIL